MPLKIRFLFISHSQVFPGENSLSDAKFCKVLQQLLSKHLYTSRNTAWLKTLEVLPYHYENKTYYLLQMMCFVYVYIHISMYHRSRVLEMQQSFSYLILDNDVYYLKHPFVIGSYKTFTAYSQYIIFACQNFCIILTLLLAGYKFM